MEFKNIFKLVYCVVHTHINIHMYSWYCCLYQNAHYPLESNKNMHTRLLLLTATSVRSATSSFKDMVTSNWRPLQTIQPIFWYRIRFCLLWTWWQLTISKLRLLLIHKYLCNLVVNKFGNILRNCYIKFHSPWLSQTKQLTKHESFVVVFGYIMDFYYKCFVFIILNTPLHYVPFILHLFIFFSGSRLQLHLVSIEGSQCAKPRWALFV